MKENKVSLSGIGPVINAIASLFNSYFKPKEDLDKIEAETEEVKSNTQKTQTQMLPDYLKTLAETKNLELEALQKTVEIYKSVGLTEDQIKLYVAQKTTEILEVYNSTKILLDLQKKGIILHASIKELKEPPTEAR